MSSSRISSYNIPTLQKKYYYYCYYAMGLKSLFTSGSLDANVVFFRKSILRFFYTLTLLNDIEFDIRRRPKRTNNKPSHCISLHNFSILPVIPRFFICHHMSQIISYEFMLHFIIVN